MSFFIYLQTLLYRILELLFSEVNAECVICFQDVDCGNAGLLCVILIINELFGWFCRVAIGTAFGYVLFDYQQNQSVYSKCTLCATGRTLYWNITCFSCILLKNKMQGVKSNTPICYNYTMGRCSFPAPSTLQPAMAVTYNCMGTQFVWLVNEYQRIMNSAEILAYYFLNIYFTKWQKKKLNISVLGQCQLNHLRRVFF